MVQNKGIYLYMDALEHARDVCKYLDVGQVERAKAHSEFFWTALEKIGNLMEKWEENV